jgi:hypothetical protein
MLACACLGTIDRDRTGRVDWHRGRVSFRPKVFVVLVSVVLTTVFAWR